MVFFAGHREYPHASPSNADFVLIIANSSNAWIYYFICKKFVPILNSSHFINLVKFELSSVGAVALK